MPRCPPPGHRRAGTEGGAYDGAGPRRRLPRTTFVQGKLPEALNQEPLASLVDIEFAFLDGPHYEDEVLAEFEFVKARKSKRGCYVLFDDCANGSWPGIAKALDKIGGVFVLPTARGLGALYLPGTEPEEWKGP